MTARAGYFDSVRAHFPSGTKALRACLQCRLIMEKTQFFELGCPQCVELKMQESEPRVIACTTQDFEGFIANIRPGGFATRYTGLEKNMPGLYALTVRGEIPPIPEDDLEAELFGLPDQPRQALPPAKRRKKRLQGLEGTSAPPSRDSSTSETHEAEMVRNFEKQMQASDSEVDEAAQKNPVPSESERSQHQASGVSESELSRGRASDSEAARSQVVVSGTSASDTGVSDRERRSNIPSSSAAESRRSGQSGTSKGSVAILEPEVDAEFDRAPQ